MKHTHSTKITPRDFVLLLQREIYDKERWITISLNVAPNALDLLGAVPGVVIKSYGEDGVMLVGDWKAPFIKLNKEMYSWNHIELVKKDHAKSTRNYIDVDKFELIKKLSTGDDLMDYLLNQ